MNIYLIHQRKTIYDFRIDDEEYYNETEENRNLVCAHMVRLILNNFSKRIDKRYSVIKFFNDVLTESINDYESKEMYEECRILKDILDYITISENRETINSLNE